VSFKEITKSHLLYLHFSLLDLFQTQTYFHLQVPTSSLSTSFLDPSFLGTFHLCFHLLYKLGTSAKGLPCVGEVGGFVSASIVCQVTAQ
jgi:hypothetical protein